VKLEQEKVKQLLNKRATLQKAAKEIVNLLAEAGFGRKNLVFKGSHISFYPLANSLISLDIVDDKLIVKIYSGLAITPVYNGLKNLAMEKGWVIERF